MKFLISNPVINGGLSDEILQTPDSYSGFGAPFMARLIYTVMTCYGQDHKFLRARPS